MRPRGPGKKTPSNKSAEQRLNWFEFYLGRKNRWSSNTLGGGASLCAARQLHVAALGAHLPPHGRTSSQTSSNVMKPPLLCQSGKNTFVFSALAAGAQNDRAPSVRRCGRRNNERKAKTKRPMNKGATGPKFFSLATERMFIHLALSLSLLPPCLH